MPTNISNVKNVDNIAINILINAPFMDECQLKKTIFLLRKLAKIKRGTKRIQLDKIIDEWAYVAYNKSLSVY